MQHPDTETEEWENEHPQMLVPKKPTWATSLKRIVHKHWHPTKINPPTVDPSLHQLTWIERTAEVTRHSFHSLEYWASPGGTLRAWLKLNAQACLLLAIPCLLVIPLITFTIGQFNAWTVSLAQTTNTLLFVPLSALLMIGLISALVYFGRSLRRRQDPRDRYGSPYYQ